MYDLKGIGGSPDVIHLIKYAFIWGQLCGFYIFRSQWFSSFRKNKQHLLNHT